MPDEMAQALSSLIGGDEDSPDLSTGAEHIKERIKRDPDIPRTNKEALIKARRGQGNRGFDSRPRLQIALRFLRFSDFAN